MNFGIHGFPVAVFFLNLVFEFLNPSNHSFPLKTCCKTGTELFTLVTKGCFNFCCDCLFLQSVYAVWGPCHKEQLSRSLVLLLPLVILYLATEGGLRSFLVNVSWSFSRTSLILHRNLNSNVSLSLSSLTFFFYFLSLASECFPIVPCQQPISSSFFWSFLMSMEVDL